MVLSLPTESNRLALPALDRDEQRQLLAIARAAIANGTRANDEFELATLPAALQCERAVFVTLTVAGGLRGCIGTLFPTQPLALAVADAAQGAAHHDPRFMPLRTEELAATRIEISVLSELEHIAADSRRALLDTLRPGVDGLLLEDGRYRSTSLPKVWSQLPNAEEFLTQLLAKAGLPADHWSASLRVHRYTALNFADADRGSA